MWPPTFAPAILRLNGRPKDFGKGRPYSDGAVNEVRALIEGTTLTYGQIARRTGASPASISRWMQIGGWKRPPFAPRSMLAVPTPRATAYNTHRRLAARLAALADRAVHELEESPTVDLEKLAEALALVQMARLAVMRRTPRRAEAAMWNEPMRPISELCAAGVDLRRAPREAVQDFLENRALPPAKDRPPRSRGMSTPKYLKRARRHAWLMERE